jgi:hypothetical protein
MSRSKRLDATSLEDEKQREAQLTLPPRERLPKGLEDSVMQNIKKVEAFEKYRDEEMPWLA